MIKFALAFAIGIGVFIVVGFLACVIFAIVTADNFMERD